MNTTEKSPSKDWRSIARVLDGAAAVAAGADACAGAAMAGAFSEGLAAPAAAALGMAAIAAAGAGLARYFEMTPARPLVTQLNAPKPAPWLWPTSLALLAVGVGLGGATGITAWALMVGVALLRVLGAAIPGVSGLLAGITRAAARALGVAVGLALSKGGLTSHAEFVGAMLLYFLAVEAIRISRQPGLELAAGFLALIQATAATVLALYLTMTRAVTGGAFWVPLAAFLFLVFPPLTRAVFEPRRSRVGVAWQRTEAGAALLQSVALTGYVSLAAGALMAVPYVLVSALRLWQEEPPASPETPPADE